MSLFAPWATTATALGSAGAAHSPVSVRPSPSNVNSSA